jgi:hypothetical protein
MLYGGCGFEWPTVWIFWCCWIFQKVIEVYYILYEMCLLWPVSFSYNMTNGPSSTAYGNRRLKYRTKLLQQQNLNITEAYRRKRNFRINTASPKFFHSERVAGHLKVCALCCKSIKWAPSGCEIKAFCRSKCDLPLYHVSCFLKYSRERDVEIQNWGWVQKLYL